MSLPSSEQWRAVVGYEGIYEVSTSGRVRCLDRTVWRGNIAVSRRGKVLRAATSSRGRRTVTLHRNGARRTGHVSQMVMEAFVGPCPPGLFVCHNDGDATNDALINLRYDTPRANNLDTVKHGRNRGTSKTHCPRGHAYDEANTYIGTRGERSCRICRSAHSRASYERKVMRSAGVGRRP